MTAEANSGLARPDWAVAPAVAVETCARFVAEVVGAADAAGVVVGLSGGIDSSLAAALAARGLGRERVLGVLLPHAQSRPESLRHGREVVAALGLRSERLEITPLVAAWEGIQPGADPVRRGNVMARSRMILLYDLARRERFLVLGTGNRSEWLLGYTTLHGDNACDLDPIGRLYKTEVRLLTAHLGLPDFLLSKAPSADLWPGQEDEDELGFTYAEADRILHHLVDEGLGPRQVEALGLAPPLVRAVSERLRAMAFKRRPVPMAEFPGRPAPAGDAT